MISVRLHTDTPFLNFYDKCPHLFGIQIEGIKKNVDSAPSLEIANTKFEHSPNKLTITEAFFLWQGCHHCHPFWEYQLVKKGVKIIYLPSNYKTDPFAVCPASTSLRLSSFNLSYDFWQAVTSFAAVVSSADPSSWRSISRHLNLANQDSWPLSATLLQHTRIYILPWFP